MTDLCCPFACSPLHALYLMMYSFTEKVGAGLLWPCVSARRSGSAIREDPAGPQRTCSSPGVAAVLCSATLLAYDQALLGWQLGVCPLASPLPPHSVVLVVWGRWAAVCPSSTQGQQDGTA